MLPSNSGFQWMMRLPNGRLRWRSRLQIGANRALAGIPPTRLTPRLFGAAVWATFFLLYSPPSWAACLEVLVKDPSGLVIKGACIRAGGYEVFSDEHGSAELCDLGSGSFTVTVRAPGFLKATRTVSATARQVRFELQLRPRVETPIVVTGTPEPRELAEVNRSVTVLSMEEPAVPTWSFADTLKQDASVDVRERGPEGTQADLSIRGSTFDQVLVLVNGIRVNDVQTGHHNMDLPLPFESVQQVEVLHGSGSTLYGSDAIGGAVNFVTKKPQAKELKLTASVGDFGWNRQSVVSGFKLGRWSQQTSFSRDFSRGFDKGRDFRTVAFSSESFLDESFGSTTVMLSAHDRPFGANGFYGPWDSWEQTGTNFVAVSQSIGKSPDRLHHGFNFAYRRHTDHFILFRDQPEIFQNFHTTDVYQGNYSVNGEWGDKISWSAGTSFLSEGIDSTNLGLHSRERVAGFFILTLRPTPRLNLALGVREEVWQKWHGETSPTVSIGYWLGRGFKLRGQVGHAYRVPSYTELFYEDPVSMGNPNLAAESAWNYEAGADWYSSAGTSVSATWFQRREANTIDWVREPGVIKFHARNFAQLTFHGGELQLRQRVNRSSAVRVSYAVMRASRLPAPGATSRYVFNFPLNSLSTSYHGSLTSNFAIRMRVGAFNRTWQSTKVLWDASLLFRAGRWQPFLQVTNLLNTHHEAFQGLAQPSRWVRCGVQLRVF